MKKQNTEKMLTELAAVTAIAICGAGTTAAQDIAAVDIEDLVLIDRSPEVSLYGLRGIDFSKAENIFYAMNYSVTAGWYSRYVCEGVDLWGTGYGFVTLGANYDDRWFFRFWYGATEKHAPDGEHYGETKLRVDYRLGLGSLEIIPWFEQSFVRQENDRGIPRPGIKTVLHLTDILSAGTDFYWQDNDGATGERGKFRGYYAVYLSAAYDLSEVLSVNASVRYGYNGGYVQRAAHGSNALDYTLAASYAVSDWWNIDALIAYSQGLTVLRSEDLGDELYGGVSVRFTY